MRRTVLFTSTWKKTIVLLSFFIALFTNTNAQTSCPGAGILDFQNMKQTKVTGLNLAGGFVKGLLQYLPPTYDPNKAGGYPVIIYFHGLGGLGQGTTTDLCKILIDSRTSDVNGITYSFTLPGLIEKGDITTTPATPFVPQVTFGGTTYEFIVISPQYTNYTYPSNYPSANSVDSIIRYVATTYNVDKSRIYLSGLSSGSNMIVEYIGSSVERASVIAGVSMASVCSDTLSAQNSGLGKPANIANGGVATYFLSCASDNTCLPRIPNQWVNGINQEGTVNPPRLYILNEANASEELQCYEGSNKHNTWAKMYDPGFNPDGQGNLYNWMIQFTSAEEIVLPVKMKEYSARLVNGKVEIKWTTTSEAENLSFTVERAGSDQRYVALKTIPGAVNSSLEKSYEFIDPQPLMGISFYRLYQTDVDGRKVYFETRKILNTKAGSKRLVVSPNPFTTQLTVFVNLDQDQALTVSLTDMSGRRVSSQKAIYGQGTSELKIRTADLVKGVYFLKVEGATFNETHRIVRQ